MLNIISILTRALLKRDIPSPAFFANVPTVNPSLIPAQESSPVIVIPLCTFTTNIVSSQLNGASARTVSPSPIASRPIMSINSPVIARRIVSSRVSTLKNKLFKCVKKQTLVVSSIGSNMKANLNVKNKLLIVIAAPKLKTKLKLAKGYIKKETSSIQRWYKLRQTNGGYVRIL